MTALNLKMPGWGQEWNNAKYFDTSKAKTINDTLYKQHYTFIPCNVVNNSVVNRNNYITLDAGANRGIGKTSGCGYYFRDCRGNQKKFPGILPPFYLSFTKISQWALKISEIKEIGDIVWDGARPEYVVLTHIPQHIRIKEGMHVVTSPYSDISRVGTPIGTSSFWNKTGRCFLYHLRELWLDMRKPEKCIYCK